MGGPGIETTGGSTATGPDLTARADEPAAERGRRRVGPDDRRALAAFAVQVVAAGVLIRYLNRDQWFRYDEFEVLLNRSFDEPSSLLRSWNGHPVTLTTVAYKALYRVVGFHHYWPYQLLNIVGHLGVVVGLRILLRRMRVNPWLANLVVGLLLVYGASQDDLAWGFSVVYTLPLALGLAQILLVDHDGPSDRRDALALVLATVAIWTGVAGPVIVAFGAPTALARRGVRAGLLHALPLLPYGVWTLLASRDDVVPPPTPIATPGVALRYSGRVVGRAIEGFGQYPVLSVAVALAVVAGIVLLLSPLRTAGWRRRPVAPLAVTAAAVAMAVVLGFTRAAPTALSPDPSVASRYLYLVAALLVPALALALDRLARTSRIALVLVLAALLVPLPRSIDQVGPPNYVVLGFETSTEVWGQVAHEVPVQGELQPEPLFNPGLTASSLASAHAAGKLDAPPPGQGELRSTAKLTLALALAAEPGPSPCRPLRAGASVRLERGQRLAVGPSGAVVAEVVGGRPRGELALAAGSWRVLWGPVEVVRSARTPDARLATCP